MTSSIRAYQLPIAESWSPADQFLVQQEGSVRRMVGSLLNQLTDYQYGSELIANADFSNGTNDWIATRASLSVVDGVLVITDSTGDYNYPGTRQVVSVTPGSHYEVRATLIPISMTGEIFVEIRMGSDNNGPTYAETSDTVNPLDVCFTITPTASTMNVLLGAADSTACVFGVRNVSIREITNLPQHLRPIPINKPALSGLSKPSQGEWVSFTEVPDAEILRLANIKTGYSNTAQFNADETKVLLNGDGYPYSVYNVPAGTLFRGSIAGGNIAYHTLSYWDSIDPDIIWGQGDALSSICKYNVVADTVQTIPIAGSFDSVLLGKYEGSMSNDGRWLAIVCNKTGQDPQIAVFDTSNNSVAGSISIDYSFDNCRMSASGKYLLVMSTQGGDQGTKVYDRATLSFLRKIGRVTHSDVGYRSDGTEVLLEQDGDRNLVSIDLRDGSSRVEVRRNAMTWSNHVSTRNILRKGYGYISMFYNEDDERTLYNEIFAVKLDGRQLIERYGQAMFPATDGYDYEAHACASPTGKYVVFNSGWGSTSPIDSYLLRLSS